MTNSQKAVHSSSIKMHPRPDQLIEFCKVCQEKFPTWEAFLLHKIESPKHICCIFCGQDFKTPDGCNRHQFLYHAAEQSLKCAGCDLVFVRAGSYISHIEQKQCPIIHKSVFEARRADRTKASKEKAIGNGTSTYLPTDVSSVCGSSLTFIDNGPTETSWDKWGEDDPATLLDEKNFPALPIQNGKNGSSSVTNNVTDRPDKLSEENLDWHLQKDMFPYLPARPTNSSKKPAAAMVMSQATHQEGFHPFDPDTPGFDFGQYYNPFSEKYRCPWPGCKKLQNHMLGLAQHLRSPAHVDAKLRCPACLRQYQSATALVQHAESQAIKCQIRDSAEYKTAVDQITGGFVDTAGRHQDSTIRYVSPATVLTAEAKGSFGARVSNASAAYWDNREEKRRETMNAMAEGNGW